jgi:CBS domain-containing protein
MLRKKGDEVYTIAPEATVLDALRIMAEQNIGALLVVSQGEMVGILSERDCIRKMDLKGRNAAQTQVNEIMTGDVVTVDCSQPLDECMSLMIERNIRHLPVYDGSALMGVVSVRDVLREVVEVQQMMLSQLERYITGGGR